MHVHTWWSLLDGESDPEKLAEKAKALGMDAIAITDHGTAAGIPDFYKACKAQGIKLIPGVEVYVCSDMNVKDKDNRELNHLVLLAKNDTGYKNLLKIVTRSNLEGLYYKPRVDNNLLSQYSEGLICMSACRGGEIPKLILEGKYERAVTLALKYKSMFENFYLELQYDGVEEQDIVNKGLMDIHDETGIPITVTVDSHYVDKEDAYSHEVLLAIQTKTTMDDPKRWRFPTVNYWLKSEEEVREWQPPEEAIENTHAIADMCNVEIEFGKNLLPKFDVPQGFDSARYLTKLCEDKMYELIAQDKIPDPKLYMDRLQYELDVINPKGLSDYFLIVWDLLRYAREQGIVLGPGRGSAAGSIVAWLLKITYLDPIEHDLLFERFLHPQRKGMPDIDLDIAPWGRPLLIDYLQKKYRNICHVGAYQTMAARGVLKDVGRTMGIDFAVMNTVTKFIPVEQGNVWSIKKCIEEIPEIKAYAEQYPDLFKIAQLLENMPKAGTVHAAGMIVCPDDITNYVAMRQGEDGYPVAELAMGPVEELGLLKIDLLALNNLNVISDCLKMIGKDIDLYSLPLNDRKVLEFLCTGDLDGVFQCTSDGMQGIYKSISPDVMDFSTVVAIISIYRPGPLQFLESFISRKNGYTYPAYAFPELEPILKDTLGIILYQEQCMRIATDIAGYNKAQSSDFRKMIAKKKKSMVEPELKRLVYGSEKDNIPGMIKNGVPEDKAKELADQLEAFAAYSFNKSHAASYAMLLYITAYLKYYYTTEFMTALMSNEKDADWVTKYIANAKEHNIRVLPPDINKSDSGFAIESKEPERVVRFGLGAIKGLGDAVVTELIANQPFIDLDDLTTKIPKKILNKSRVEALLYSGALDTLSPLLDRNQIAMELNRLRGTKVTIDPFDEGEKEKEVLGMYLMKHPLQGIAQPMNWRKLIRGQRFICVGMITDIHKTITKNKEPMAFVDVETLEGTQKFVAFPKVFKAFKWNKGSIVKLEAKKDKDSHIIELVAPYQQQAV